MQNNICYLPTFIRTFWVISGFVRAVQRRLQEDVLAHPDLPLGDTVGGEVAEPILLRMKKNEINRHFNFVERFLIVEGCVNSASVFTLAAEANSRNLGNSLSSWRGVPRIHS